MSRPSLRGKFIRIRCCECPRLIYVPRRGGCRVCEPCRKARRAVHVELRRLAKDRQAEAERNAKRNGLAPEDDGPPPRLGIPAALSIINDWMRG